jgi:transposase
MESRKTTFEERLKIVKWVIAHDMNYTEAAEKNGIKYALVYQWVQKYLKGGVEALRYRKRGPKSKSVVDESSLSDVEKLKLELEREKTLRKHAEFKLEVLKKKRSSRRSFAIESKTKDKLSDSGLL